MLAERSGVAMARKRERKRSRRRASLLIFPNQYFFSTEEMEALEDYLCQKIPKVQEQTLLALLHALYDGHVGDYEDLLPVVDTMYDAANKAYQDAIEEGKSEEDAHTSVMVVMSHLIALYLETRFRKYNFNSDIDPWDLEALSQYWSKAQPPARRAQPWDSMELPARCWIVRRPPGNHA